MSLTSTILLAQVGEPPDVSEAHTEPKDCEEELDWAVPGHPLDAGCLHVHILLAVVIIDMLELNHLQ